MIQRLRAPLELPAVYDDLTYRERRQAREQYADRQDGLCWYCKGKLTEEPPAAVSDKRINKKLFPATFFDHPLHLHHDHGTGLTVGTVHNLCNAVLWQYHGK